MRAFSCDSCGEYHHGLGAKAFARTIIDEHLGILVKKFNITIELQIFDTYELPDLCIKCFKALIIKTIQKEE